MGASVFDSPVDLLCLVTDFGHAGPYVGQMQAVLQLGLPRLPVVNLMADFPKFQPRPGSYLLPAVCRDLPATALVTAVVDPGVGGPRDLLLVQGERHWFLGPDNGLLALVARCAARPRVWRCDWRPDSASQTFHGRDILAPLALRLLAGEDCCLQPLDPAGIQGWDWPAVLSEVIYVDAFGNLLLGVPAATCRPGDRFDCAGQLLSYARTFCEVATGRAFWYENALGLVEIAVNGASAAARLGVGVGCSVTRLPS